MNAVESRNSEIRSFRSRERTGNLHRSAFVPPYVRLLEADLCRLPLLSLLPNERFSGFLDCTAFIGFSKAQQSPNNLHFGNGKLDIRAIPVLNPQLDDSSFLLGYTPILDDFKTTRCRNNDAF